MLELPTHHDRTMLGHVASRFEVRARALVYARLTMMLIGLAALFVPAWRSALGLVLPHAAIGYGLLLGFHALAFFWVGRRHTRTVVFGSLCADLLVLLYLVAFSGGIASPLMPTQVVYTLLFALLFPSPLAIIPPLLLIPIVAVIDQVRGAGAGSIDVLLVLWSTALNVAVVYVVVYLEGRDRSSLRELIAGQRERRQQALASQRTRIAREIHDGVGAALSGVLLQAEYLVGETRNTELGREIAEIRSLGAEAMDELRRAVSILHQEFHLAASIPAYAETFGQRNRIQIEVTVRGVEPELTPEQQLALFRITQESLSNIVRHAGADRVEIELSFIETGWVDLRIRDNGKGFDPKRAVPGHYGLRNMNERAAKVGGMLDVDSAEGKGCVISVRVPIEGIDGGSSAVWIGR